MRLHSRELFVGFLLVVGLSGSGCQPTSSVPEVPAKGESTATVENQVLSETATPDIGTSISVTASTAVSESSAVSESVVADVPATAVMSSTGESAPLVVAAPADPALMAAGLSVYRAQYCGVCHTLDAAETRGTFGPPHNGMGSIAAGHLQEPTYSGAATTTAEYIRESIVDPQRYIVPGYATTSHRMPSYAHLDLASLDALVAFLLAQ